MDTTNEAIQFWRDMRLWSGIIGAVLVASSGIIALYSQHRISLLEDQKKKEELSKKTKINSRVLNSPIDTTSLKQHFMKDQPKKIEGGDTYNVTSNNQTSGITAGRIDKIIISEEDENKINPMENFSVIQENLTFKVKPKIGKWIQPFFMIPKEEKDSCTFKVGNASGQMFNLATGVEEESNGIKYYGAIFGFESSVLNPATKDFYYSITFTNHLPSYFVFGDHSKEIAFIWDSRKK